MPDTTITIEWTDTHGNSHKWAATEQGDGESFVYREWMDNLPINNGSMNEDELDTMIPTVLERTVQ